MEQVQSDTLRVRLAFTAFPTMADAAIISTDNPPPKVVQGYKFNIFYPDLM